MLSAVIHLQALENGALPADSGRALNALFLDWVRETDPHKSAELHDGSGLRPYTVSDLVGITRFERGFKLVRGGDSTWMRVTSLEDESLSALLKTSVLPGLAAGRVFSIGMSGFCVTGVSISAAEHPWAGEISYKELVETHLFDPQLPEPTVEMEFASPTTFRSHGKNLPLPLPELLLESWLGRWNAFSPHALPMEARAFAQDGLAVSAYTLKTAAAHTGQGTFIGFQGRLTLRALSEDPYWLRMLHLLADFSFFCGTGAKTSFGLGQTRLVSGREAR